MNIHATTIEREPTRDEAERALAVLRAWADTAAPEEVITLDPAIARVVPGHGEAAYPTLARTYPAEFRVDDAYRTGLPDLQNGPESLIKGAHRQIQHVGISNFRLPLRYRNRAGGYHVLETSVTGTVSLAADKKGINMSRIMRSFYRHAEDTVSFGVIEAALDDYKVDLDSLDARIQMRFSFPMRVDSLRSGLSGYQYYDIALELVERDGVRKKIIHLDYVYSSTCPCSLELSEHARQFRRGRSGFGQRRKDCGLPGQAVIDKPGHAIHGRGYGGTVACMKNTRTARAQPAARSHEICQVAIRWRDQRTGPTHHQIARENNVIPGKAEMVSKMARRP